MPKSKKVKDPFAARESAKYGQPIASREFIMKLMEDAQKPLTLDTLITRLHYEDDFERQEALRRRLGAMERDGQLVYNRRGGYLLVKESDLIRGRVIGHKDGFGFVAAEDGGTDLYLSPRQMRMVFDGDRVVVSVAGMDRRGRR